MTNGIDGVVVGKRQILRELKNNNIAEIRIACDAETKYIGELIAVAKQHNVRYVIASTMDEIAAQYGIEVPSGAVGVLANAQQ